MTQRFLITGFPRMRSAWLAALFSSDLVHCFHDAAHHGSVTGMLNEVVKSTSQIVGLCDPSAACVYPQLAIKLFAESPIVIVRREADDAKQALETWAGMEMKNWHELGANYDWFARSAAHACWIDYADLDDYFVVSELYRHCTGLLLDKHRFDLFNTLKIEQHREKAILASGIPKH